LLRPDKSGLAMTWKEGSPRNDKRRRFLARDRMEVCHCERYCPPARRMTTAGEPGLGRRERGNPHRPSTEIAELVPSETRNLGTRNDRRGVIAPKKTKCQNPNA